MRATDEVWATLRRIVERGGKLDMLAVGEDLYARLKNEMAEQDAWRVDSAHKSPTDEIHFYGPTGCVRIIE